MLGRNANKKGQHSSDIVRSSHTTHKSEETGLCFEFYLQIPSCHNILNKFIIVRKSIGRSRARIAAWAACGTMVVMSVKQIDPERGPTYRSIRFQFAASCVKDADTDAHA